MSGMQTWWSREWIVTLGEDIGPAGPVVVRWLEAHVRAGGVVELDRPLIERECFVDEETVNRVLKHAEQIGMLSVVGNCAILQEFHISGRSPLARVMRQRVISRDGNVCGICGSAVTDGFVDIDHILPVSLGGADDLANLQVAHARCNRSKGARIA
jgi:hypothetical protein